MFAYLILALAMTAFTLINAHMLMVDPPHFGNAITNAPLDNLVDPKQASPGSPYPCKFDGSASLWNRGKVTKIPSGANHTVVFKGQAVHGGGLCQFSLTKDLAPGLNSTFKVTHSVQCGCPARVTNNSNLGDNADAIDPFTYNFTMNPKIPKGQYVFAWTWFNKIGNREMYMNCAAVDVTDATGPTPPTMNSPYYQEWNDLPDILVANIAAAPRCSTTQRGASLKFPNPGNCVETFEQDQFVYPSDYCYAPKFTPTNVPQSLSAESTSLKSSVMQSSNTQGPMQMPSTLPLSPNPQAPAPYSPPGGSSAANLAGAGTPQTPTVYSAHSATPAASPGGSGSAGDSCSQKCSQAGLFTCIGETHFGICANGCIKSESVANGTVCRDGQIISSTQKRTNHRRRRHASKP